MRSLRVRVPLERGEKIMSPLHHTLERMPHFYGTGSTLVRQTALKRDLHASISLRTQQQQQHTGVWTAGFQLAVTSPQDQCNHRKSHVQQGNGAIFKSSRQSSLTATRVGKDAAAAFTVLTGRAQLDDGEHYRLNRREGQSF